MSRLQWLTRVPRIVITILMIVAMVDMVVGVFLRYVMTKLTADFGLPRVDFFWVEEVGETALTWITFIGAAIGIRRGTHFAIHLVTDRLPPRVARAMLVVHYGIVAAFGAVVAIYGWQVMELNSQSFSPALGINLRWMYCSAVVGGLLIIAYALATVRDIARGQIPGHYLVQD